MKYQVPIRNPNKGYRYNWLWLPKNRCNLDMLKNSLEIDTPRNGTVRLWREEKNHILVPREFMNENDLDFEVCDLTPDFPKVSIDSSIELDKLWPDKSIQRDAYRDLVGCGGGILNLACGRGKTIIFLHALATWSEPTLIINDKENILLQWKESIEKFLRFDGAVGWIQSKPTKWDWKHPITLAMLRSLSLHAHDMPEGMDRWFGRVIWDEIHHLPAPSFATTSSVFPGKRFGATATPERKDGRQVLYYGHVGPVIHSNLEQDLNPRVIFRRSPTFVDLADREIRKKCTSRSGDIHHKKISAYVGTQPEELELCADILNRGIEAGRRILALSHSREQILELHKRLPYAGVVIGGNPKKPEDRSKVISESQLILSTSDIAREALDETRLDSLVLLNEFSDENLLQQAVGRIQRKLPDGEKKLPTVIIIFHRQIPPMRAMGVCLKSHFKRWGIETETI